MTLRLVVHTQRNSWGSKGLEWFDRWYYLQQKVEDKWKTLDLVQHDCLTEEEKAEILSHVPRWIAEGKIKL